MSPPFHNNMAMEPVCGLVLAGGHSRRMGSDKANLRHPQDGLPLALRTADLLAQAECEPVVLSLRPGQARPDGFTEQGRRQLRVVRDFPGTSGPLAGLLAGMESLPSRAWLVVACDLPRLDLATLRHLIESARPNEPFLAYRSEHDDLPEPLCTLYMPAALPILRQSAAANLCPRKILIRHDCRLLEPISPGALSNANTPEDWQAATQTKTP